MKNRLSDFAISTAIGSVVLCAGCATGPVPVSVSAPALSIQYDAPALSDELRSAGLQSSFVDYWQSHVNRDWKRRYEIEKFPRPLEEKFYVAYHANAWPLKSIKVTGVQVSPKEVSIDIVLTVVDIEKKKEIPQYQKDKWVAVEGTWRHIVQDPMLSGMFQ